MKGLRKVVSVAVCAVVVAVLGAAMVFGEWISGRRGRRDRDRDEDGGGPDNA